MLLVQLFFNSLPNIPVFVYPSRYVAVYFSLIPVVCTRVLYKRYTLVPVHGVMV